ncbi:MAG: hypothetical protein AB1651_17675 [Pseudomonadota bacterium]
MSEPSGGALADPQLGLRAEEREERAVFQRVVAHRPGAGRQFHAIVARAVEGRMEHSLANRGDQQLAARRDQATSDGVVFVHIRRD